MLPPARRVSFTNPGGWLALYARCVSFGRYSRGRWSWACDGKARAGTASRSCRRSCSGQLRESLSACFCSSSMVSRGGISTNSSEYDWSQLAIYDVSLGALPAPNTSSNQPQLVAHTRAPNAIEERIAGRVHAAGGVVSGVRRARGRGTVYYYREKKKNEFVWRIRGDSWVVQKRCEIFGDDIYNKKSNISDKRRLIYFLTMAHLQSSDSPSSRHHGSSLHHGRAWQDRKTSR